MYIQGITNGLKIGCVYIWRLFPQIGQFAKGSRAARMDYIVPSIHVPSTINEPSVIALDLS